MELEMEAAPDPVVLVVKALAFAARKHRTQRRKDAEGSPYINHPIALVEVLSGEAGLCDPLLLAGALLHDTVEDTDTSLAEIAGEFGEEVRALVAEVTDDKSLPKADRKRLQVVHAATASRRARALKLADKICNLRDVVEAPPAGWSLERKREYFDWAKQVVDALRGPFPKLEALFDDAYGRKP